MSNLLSIENTKQNVTISRYFHGRQWQDPEYKYGIVSPDETTEYRINSLTDAFFYPPDVFELLACGPIQNAPCGMILIKTCPHNNTFF